MSAENVSRSAWADSGNRRFQSLKRSQLFIGTHNETNSGENKSRAIITWEEK
jgi:hypothetical protein